MKKKAFTLVEVQFAVLIASFILIAALSSYIFFFKAFSAGNVHMDVYSNSRIAMGMMSKDIKLAAQVLPDSTLGHVTSNSCIVLNVLSLPIPSGGVVTQFDEIVYQVTGDDLHRIVYPSSASSRAAEDRVVATHCLQLAFSSSTATSGGLQPLSYFISSDPLLDQSRDIDIVHISLPLTAETVFATNPGGASLRPTTVVKLRNKQ